MALLREWLIRVANLFGRGRTDDDLARELASHAELAAEHGAPPSRDAANAIEALRDQRSVPAVDNLVRDFRHAVRMLRRNPLFAMVAIGTLAIGVAANTTIFSVINSVLLNPLPYPNPDQLMFLSTRVPALGFAEFWASPPEYFEFAELNQSFASVGVYRTIDANVAAGSGPVRVRSAQIDDGLMRTLGVPAAHGRWFDGREAAVNGPPVAILSHELWQSSFGGRPMIDEAIEVDGLRRTVVGVMPPGFDIMDQRVRIWLPLGLNRADRSNRATHSLFIAGRLKAEVTVAAAQADLEYLLAHWGELAGVKGAGIAGHVFTPAGVTAVPGAATPGHILQMSPMKERIVGNAYRAVWIVQAAVGLIMLIVCANLASLLLARAETRRHELAIRTAVGASRARILQQFIAEGLLVSLAGGMLGMIIAAAVLPVLTRAQFSNLPRAFEIAIEPAAIAFGLLLSTVAGVALGLAPVLQVNVAQLAQSMRGSDPRIGSGQRHAIRNLLVVGQVALAVTVTIAAALLLRTVNNLAAVDAGFERSGLSTFSIALPPRTYVQSAQRLQVYQRVIDALRAIPGVQQVTAMSGLPLDRPLDALATDMEGYTAAPDTTPEVLDYYQRVMPDYFETMGIPIVRGRAFERADAAGGYVAIVNESLAKTYWSGLDPIGRRLRPCCAETIPWFTVIGVAADVRQQSVDQTPGTEFYMYVEQTARFAPPQPTMNFVLRAGADMTALRPSIERAVRTIDPSIPVVRQRDMHEVFVDSIRRPQLIAGLLSVFSALALVLAAMGIYGLLAYLVSERRKEIGIRLSLGAGRPRIAAGVMGRGLRLTGFGIAIGMGLALVVTRFMTALLFGVAPLDTVAFATAAAGIVAAAVFACVLPAAHAARVDPTSVMRVD